MENIKKLDTSSFNHIKHVIAIVSGKGGVGKSFVSSLIASKLNKLGYKVGILDGDITGPSISKSFNVHGSLSGDQNGLIFPLESKEGIKIVSSNLILPHEDDPIVWRAQLINSLLIQFFQDVLWGELDYLIIDMPPGTSDVTLTSFQSFPLDGIIVVSSPQELVKMIVSKAIKMAKMLDVKVLGIIENMSYINCPKCNEKIYPFGKSNIEEYARDFGIDCYAYLPINSEFNNLIDKGKISQIDINDIDNVIDMLRSL